MRNGLIQSTVAILCAVIGMATFLVALPSGAADVSIRHLLSIPRLGKAPAIDGKLDAAEWAGASATTGFFRADKLTAATVQPVVYAGYDDKTLYFAFVSPIPKGKSLIANVRGIGGPVWDDDDVEILLQPDPPAGHVHHFLGGPAGGFTSLLDDSTREMDVTYRTTATEDTWVAEFAIPFKTLGQAVPSEGAIWGLNLCRGIAVPREWASWAPAVSFTYAPNFGRIRFGGSAARVTSIGDTRTGDVNVEGALPPQDGELTFRAGAGARSLLQTRAIDPNNVHDAGKAEVDLLGGVTRQVPASSAATPISYRKKVVNQPSRVTWEIVSADGTPVQRHYVDFDPAPPLIMDIDCSPRRGTIEINLDAAGGYTAGIALRGEVAFRPKDGKGKAILAKAEFKRHEGKAVFILKDIPVGDYKVEGTITPVGGQAMKVSANFSQSGPIPPDYFKMGFEPKVPAPWTPVTVQGNEVGVWGRKVTFNGSGLPSAVTSAGLQALSAPIALRAFYTGVECRLTKGAASVRRLSDEAAVATGSVKCPGLTIGVKSRMEFDGCIRVDMNVEVRKGPGPNEMFLDIPFRGDFAELIHSHTLAYSPTTSGSIPAGHGVVWKHQFAPVIWIGNTRAGLCWFGESQEGWALPAGDEPSQEVIRTADGVMLRIHLARTVFPRGKKRHIVFGLQATPMKAVRPDWRRHRMGAANPFLPEDSYFDSYMPEPGGKWWGWPEPKSEEQYKKMMDEIEKGVVERREDHIPYSPKIVMESRDKVHAAGGQMIWYFPVQQLGCTSPWFDTYGKDWNLTEGSGYTNPADPWWNSGAVCPASEWQNLYVGTVDESMRKTGFDGVYLDTFLPWKCSNATHGCGYIDGNGKRQGHYTIWAMREEVKRAYRVVHSRKNGYIMGHISADIIPPIYSFIDTSLDGEQYWVNFNLKGNMDYHEVLSLDKCRTEVLGRQWGWAPFWFPQLYAKGTRAASRELLSLILLHDCLVWPAYFDQGEYHLANAILSRLGFINSQYIGYFDKPAPVKTDNPDVLVSAYRDIKGHPGRAILIVTNHSTKDGDFTITPDAEVLRLKPGAWTATDYESRLEPMKMLPVTGGSFTVHIPAKDFHIVCVE